MGDGQPPCKYKKANKAKKRDESVAGAGPTERILPIQMLIGRPGTK